MCDVCLCDVCLCVACVCDVCLCDVFVWCVFVWCVFVWCLMCVCVMCVCVMCGFFNAFYSPQKSYRDAWVEKLRGHLLTPFQISKEKWLNYMYINFSHSLLIYVKMKKQYFWFSADRGGERECEKYIVREREGLFEGCSHKKEKIIELIAIERLIK